MHGKRAHNGLKPPRQREWGRHCRNIREAWGDVAATAIEPKHVLSLQDAWAEKPASREQHDPMSQQFDVVECSPRLALDKSLSRNQVAQNRGDGYEPWPWNVIEVASAELRPDL